MPLPSQILKNKFEHQPTQSQEAMFHAFDQFIESKADKSAFILKGYAGTGKTTIVATLVKVLPLFNLKYVLLAPTGRAAKVISQYAKKTAFTIHKKIYKTKGNEESGPVFKRIKNYHADTLFIVDEASMISTTSDNGGSNLLSDLFDFVFEGKNNKLMVVGDIAQLPPVLQEKSYALDGDFMRREYHSTVIEHTLVDITRQAFDSGILSNATAVRNLLANPKHSLKFSTKSHKDIFRMNGDKLEEGLRYAYDKFGIENALVICRSNKNAVMYNQFIRNTLLFKEDELDAGDLLLIARNNYTFVDDQIPSGFLANGDFVEIRKVKRYEEMHGFRFADLEIAMVDIENAEPFEAKIMLDTLHAHSPSMSREDNLKLYKSVLIDYADLKKKDQADALKKDKYLNALQVKYAYALTCHKSQGGQWDSVFVDQGYLNENFDQKEFIRWIYTAMTRAKKELFLVNFDTKFF